MGRFSTTAGYAHADKVKAVYEHLGEIRKVADRLTPVENLVVFQAQIEDLHAQLTLLVEASETIVGMSEVGEALVTGSLASIKTLLGIGELPPDVVLWSVLTPILEDLESRLGNGLGGVGDDIDEIRQGLIDLGHYVSSQQAIIQGLVTSYEGLQNGLASTQENLSVAISRLNIHEGRFTASDSRMDVINQNVTDALHGLTLANTAISGITSSIEILDNRVTLQNSAISALSGQLTNLETGQSGLVNAVNGIHTTLQGINDDLLAQASRTTTLSAAIGGNGNLLPNAGFEGGTGGWQIVHADGDWANSVLDVNSIGTMPAEVNALDVQGLPAPLGEIVVDSPYVLVEADKHVIVSGYPCVDNGQITFGYRLYDNAGVMVDQGVCPPAFNATTSGIFTDYTRTWVKFLVPAGASKLRLYFKVNADGDFLSRAALFRPMVEHVWAEQEEPSTWVPNLSGVADGLANALATLRVEVQTNTQGITALGEDLVQLTAEVADKADASALNALSVIVSQQGNTISSLASDLTTLTATVANKADASALSALTLVVTNQGNQLSSIGTQITDINVQLLAPFGAAISWVFVAANLDTPQYNGFTVSGATLASFPAGNNFGATAITSTGADPVFTSPAMSIPGRLYGVVRALVRKRTAGGVWEGGLRWTTSGHGFDSVHYMTAPVPPDNEWTWLEWKITHADWLASTITGLRFDFAASNGIIVDVREIHVGAYGTPSSGRAQTLLESRVVQNAQGVTALSQDVTSLRVATGLQLMPGKNLLQNPSAKMGVEPWQLTTTVAASVLTSVSASGTTYLQVSNGATAGNRFVFQNAFHPDLPGKTVTFSADVWLAGSTAGSVDLDMIGLDASNTAIWFPGGGTPLSGQGAWHRISKTLTLPSNVVGIRARVRGIGVNYSMFAVRNAKLEVSASPTAFTDDQAYASATQALQVQATQLQNGQTTLLAKHSLNLDVNGHIVGWVFNNDGTTGNFAIRSDMFSIVAPGGGARTEFSNGNWRVYDAAGTLRVRLGVW